MALHQLLRLRRRLLLLLLNTTALLSLVKGEIATKKTLAIKATSVVYPINCSQPSLSPSCDAYLYAVSDGLSILDVATIYSTNTTQIQPVIRSVGGNTDFLVRVPCQCQESAGTTAFFYTTQYKVLPQDTPYNLTTTVFSGLAWKPGGGGQSILAGDVINISLPCGCSSSGGLVVSYTVEQSDTLYSIAAMLDSDVSGIESMNRNLTEKPEFLNPGWVLFVPMGQSSPPKKEKKNTMNLKLGISMSLAFVVIGGLFLFCRHRRLRQRNVQVEDPPNKKPKSSSQKMSPKADLQSKEHSSKNIEDVGQFESERPLVFSLAQVNIATANFDETRKIGEGGYGKVYHGMLGDQEVAIKKMRSSMSKEFYAELKVLCKVHHINVVELLGYASGDGHLYLVYEYVINGSLSEHLHDPLIKGHQPLSWFARAQIALDAARGIEYIHDHTKARYVHRDIKTSNILLDNGLRAKVADFGLAKLMERTSEDEFIATRLVGTPGYLPPEAVRELQMTSKTDVFAFGVVLAELITGRRALFRDKNEPLKPRSLASTMIGIFREENIESALEDAIDGNLKNSYPAQQVYKMAEIAACCLNEDAMNRPEMMEITMELSQILMSSIEWEASLGGDDVVFSGVMSGR